MLVQSAATFHLKSGERASEREKSDLSGGLAKLSFISPLYDLNGH
jgi:hypothetical protein